MCLHILNLTIWVINYEQEETITCSLQNRLKIRIDNAKQIGMNLDRNRTVAVLQAPTCKGTLLENIYKGQFLGGYLYGWLSAGEHLYGGLVTGIPGVSGHSYRDNWVKRALWQGAHWPPAMPRYTYKRWEDVIGSVLFVISCY